MSTLNHHTSLRQAITSIKGACARAIKSRGSEYQPLLHQEVVSTKQDSSYYQNEKAAVTTIQVRKASTIKPRFEIDYTRKLTSAELADMLHREAMFHYMAMRL